MFKRSVLQLGRSSLFARSAINYATKSSFSTIRAKAPRHQQLARLGLVLGFGIGAGAFITGQASSKVQLDAPKSMKGPIDHTNTVKITDDNGIELIQPPTNSPPFPVELSLNTGTETEMYDLLGVGVRTVSFIRFHVYALGIYIARDDQQLAHNVLAGAVKLDEKTHDLKTALLDPEQGNRIIGHLLDHGVRLDIRIVPVRGTDFSHLRDGFVRQILAHPLFKELSRSSSADASGSDIAASLGDGINQLKVAFSRKMSVPKHNILHLARHKNGSLTITYYNSKSESSKKVETLVLGTVDSPSISKILMLQYLAGNNVSSESARQTCIETLSKL